jgi:hypothetical protein
MTYSVQQQHGGGLRRCQCGWGLQAREGQVVRVQDLAGSSIKHIDLPML